MKREVRGKFLVRVLLLWEVLLLLATGCMIWGCWQLFRSRILLFFPGGMALFAGLVWVPSYYSTFFFSLSDGKLFCERGVFFRKAMLFHQKEMLFVTQYQDPVASLFGLCHLRIAFPGAVLTLICLECRQAEDLMVRLGKENDL